MTKVKATEQPGIIMDTIQEIQERHDTLIDIERSPNELHQVFLDMAVLVQSQGKQLHDIECHVARVNSYVCGGSSSCSLQGSTRRIPEVHIHWQFGIIILIIIILIIVLLSRNQEKSSQHILSVCHIHITIAL
ncbi:hypothetical protein HN51_060427 [Arachis hypogaea]